MYFYFLAIFKNQICFLKIFVSFKNNPFPSIFSAKIIIIILLLPKKHLKKGKETIIGNSEKMEREGGEASAGKRLKYMDDGTMEANGPFPLE